MTTLIEFLVNELPKRGGWPKGAVEAYRHVSDDFPIFYDEDGGIVSREYGRSLNLCSVDLNLDDYELGETVTREQYESALSASKPEWDGEGLPPVGCSFEYMASSGRWFIAKMKYCGKSFAIVDIDGSESWISLNQKIRPIRSEEDKKRAEGVIALSRIDPQTMQFEYGDNHPDGSLIGPFWYELYDAIAGGKIPHIRIY